MVMKFLQDGYMEKKGIMCRNPGTWLDTTPVNLTGILNSQYYFHWLNSTPVMFTGVQYSQ